ncbi:MAG TPA: calcium/sodium antiporter [Thermoplasmata archaeon]|nr:calcium/sodium antiporter [Thermoplasmata archaeon]HIH97649.1 calcium/sodium antiporter [Thermoplasmata archaeon]
MEIWLAFIIFVLAVVLIVKSAGWFVEGASAIARLLGVSEVMIGLTIVSFATTAPEFVTSVSASYRGDPGLAVGNAVGSCLCNIGLILAVVGIVQVTKIEKKTLHNWAIPMLIFVGITFAFSLNGEISRIDGGLILALFLLFYIFLVVRLLRHPSNKEKLANLREKREKLKQKALQFLVGAAGVVVGSQLLVRSGEAMAKNLGVPEIIIGITLLAMGTSLPELVTAIVSIRKHMGKLSIGNIIGANFLNLAWVISTAALVNPLTIDPETLTFTFPLLLLLTAVLLGCLYWKYELNRWKGAILLGIYLAYLIGLLGIYGIIGAIF